MILSDFHDFSCDIVVFYGILLYEFISYVIFSLKRIFSILWKSDKENPFLINAV